MLGVTLVLADGTVASAGGKVVKNVAGYDLARLVCGSRGRLALIARASFRLHPLPRATRTLVVATDDPARVVTALRSSQLEPSALDIIHPGRVAVLFEGAERAVDAQLAAARGLVGGEAADDGFWDELRRRQGDAEGRLRFDPGDLAHVLEEVPDAVVRPASGRRIHPRAEHPVIRRQKSPTPRRSACSSAIRASSTRTGCSPHDPGATADCVHCGFCLPTCPTYVLWSEEMDSPRGRIHLMDARLDGTVALNATVTEHFDRCLGCMACVTSCPSGVRYDRLIEATRAAVEEEYDRPFGERLLRGLLFSREDARLERDLVGGQPARVAAAVEALVVGEHPGGDVAQARRARGSARRSPGGGVISLHSASVERAGLVQDRVGDPELAEVVQHAGGLQAVDPRGASPSAAAVSRANRADGARVLGRAGVAQVERLGEQHRGREPQLGRLAARRAPRCRVTSTCSSASAVWSATAISTRTSSSVGRRPVSGSSTETMPSTSPVAPRSGQQQRVVGIPRVRAERARGLRRVGVRIASTSRRSRRAATSAPRRSCAGSSSGCQVAHGLTLPSSAPRASSSPATSTTRRSSSWPSRRFTATVWKCSSVRISSAIASSTGSGPRPDAAAREMSSSPRRWRSSGCSTASVRRRAGFLAASPAGRAHAVAAAVLGLVERAVGVREQRGRVALAGRDADRDGDDAARVGRVGQRGALDRRAHALGGGERLARRRRRAAPARAPRRRSGRRRRRRAAASGRSRRSRAAPGRRRCGRAGRCRP